MILVFYQAMLEEHKHPNGYMRIARQSEKGQFKDIVWFCIFLLASAECNKPKHMTTINILTGST